MWLIKNWNGKCSLDAYSQAWMNNRGTWNQISRLTASDIKVPPTILPLSFSQFWNCFSLLWAWRMLHQICKVPAATKVWIKLLHMVRNTNRAPVRSIGLFERQQKILSRTQTHLKLLVYIRDETRCLALDQMHTEQALALQRWRNTRLFRDQIIAKVHPPVANSVVSMHPPWSWWNVRHSQGHLFCVQLGLPLQGRTDKTEGRNC